jgi:phosphoribosyl 1,2-cyclic phosphodiesterase
MISTCSLQSGSNGNCFYVETADTKLLFDAGVSGRAAQLRLAQHGRDIREVDALIISHNHSDHVRHAGVYQRKFSIPLYITPGAWQASRGMLGQVPDIRFFEPGQFLQFDTTVVESVPTPHDGVDCVAFVISCAGKKLGIFTDLGHRFEGLDRWITELDALYLESNYDPDMLDRGDYPFWLKRRIRGAGGHLSNGEAAQLVNETASSLQLLILSHLSEHNNHPELALATARDILGMNFPVTLAGRSEVSEMFTIR